MSTKTLFCIGYGYTAQAVAHAAIQQGWRVSGTTRSAEKAREIARSGVEAIVWEGGGDNTALVHAAQNAHAVLISNPPGPQSVEGPKGEGACPALNALADAITERNALAWIGYLSTNGVYGNHDGAWVDETISPRPTNARSKNRIAAEEGWRGFGKKHAITVSVFRLPGIYGPGRSALDTVRAGRARRIYKKDQVFSRAHVADIASAVLAGLRQSGPAGLYNIADDEPAPPQDVIAYACDLLGVEPPPLTPIEQADLSEMARSFYSDNKRIRNDKAKAALGWAPRYPSYREGLDAIFTDELSPSADASEKKPHRA